MQAVGWGCCQVWQQKEVWSEAWWEFLAKGTLGITCWSASQSLRQDQLSISEPPARLGRGFRQAGVAGEAR